MSIRKAYLLGSVFGVLTGIGHANTGFYAGGSADYVSLMYQYEYVEMNPFANQKAGFTGHVGYKAQLNNDFYFSAELDASSHQATLDQAGYNIAFVPPAPIAYWSRLTQIKNKQIRSIHLKPSVAFRANTKLPVELSLIVGLGRMKSTWSGCFAAHSRSYMPPNADAVCALVPSTANRTFKSLGLGLESQILPNLAVFSSFEKEMSKRVDIENYRFKREFSRAQMGVRYYFS